MDFKTHAQAIRIKILEMAHASKSPHVGSSLSVTDILTTLYFGVLRLECWEERDICILSKAHSAMALYGTLAQKGIMDEVMLEGYYRNKGTLPAHLDPFSAKGIETAGGSLGHGLPMGLGLAFGFKQARKDRNVFVVMGDGESQEGSVWEAALFAPKLGVDNLTVIIDYNNLQGYGRARDLCAFEPFADKWRAFGWDVCEVDGHDYEALQSALTLKTSRPKAIIARTTKGKGVSFMEDQLIWHYYIVTAEHLAQAKGELA